MAPLANTTMTDTVLEEADRLLEEEGLVSSPIEPTAKEPVEIQSERGEPPNITSFAAKAELFLTELQAMKHSTRRLVQQARAQKLETITSTVEALVAFM